MSLYVLLQFVIDSRKAQKYLLGVFEMLVGEVHPQLMPKVPHILKAFYDNDIVEEEAVLEWADKVREAESTVWVGRARWSVVMSTSLCSWNLLVFEVSPS